MKKTSNKFQRETNHNNFLWFLQAKLSQKSQKIIMVCLSLKFVWYLHYDILTTATTFSRQNDAA